MKELTLEEKAKAYNEIMYRAKKELDACGSQDCDAARQIFRLFPELKDSEDERIRKALIDYFRWNTDSQLLNEFTNREVFAWLEKQKTSEEAIQYLKENHSPSEVSDFQAAMNIAVAKAYDKGVKDGLENRGQTFTKEDVDDAYLKGVRDAKKELKKIGQRMISAEAKEAMYGNPAWSGEDENEVAILESYIRSGEWSESHIDRALGIVDELVNKVKSLRPQKQWKPSEEQIMCLQDALSDYHRRGYKAETLETLLKQLKQL